MAGILYGLLRNRINDTMIGVAKGNSLSRIAMLTLCFNSLRYDKVRPYISKHNICYCAFSYNDPQLYIT